jgi:predicted cupin superfamily sugar epimerase
MSMPSGISGDLGGNEVIRLLDLQPHMEGGWFRRTFEDSATDGGRAASTAIYYLLQAEEMSACSR